MDSQHSSHGKTYAYSHPQYPEFYDLWVESLFGSGPSEDSEVFWNVFSNNFSTTSEQETFTVLDVGTGTGRVLKDLLAHISEITPHPQYKDGHRGNIVFIGTDHSESMLQRAKKTYADLAQKVAEQRRPAVEWKTLSATEIGNALGSNKTEKAALVIFAAGGVGHLVEKGELQNFFNQISGVLSETGLAVVSVLDDLVENDDKGTEDIEYRNNLRIESREFKGGVYTKTPTTFTWNEDRNIMTEVFTVRFEKNGIFEWEEELRWSLKVFNEKEWRSCLAEAGLEVTEVKAGRIQRWWILRKQRIERARFV